MAGWLVYSPEGYALNRWFAERLAACAADEGVELLLRTVADGCSLPAEPAPDFVAMRAIRPDLSAALEARGVRVFNNAATARTANDKWETFRLARELDLPAMDTERLSLPEPPQMGFPCVVKSLDGHGGSEVALVHDAVELEALAARTGKRDFIAQPLCDEPGVDVRAYVLDGEAVAAVRRSSRTDFRSNFKLGGNVAPTVLDDAQRDAVARLHGRLGFDFAGVDFIRHGGRWVVNEVEDVVGTRMLYATSAIDAARLFMRHIAHAVS